jgi:8-oxo-dGTP pyrophosphatase MutT (NUDIX family)
MTQAKKKSPSVCRCAVIFISTQKGVYLSKRIDSSRPFFNFWQCPGGKVDNGESPKEGAIRELLEETGLTISPSRLKWLGRNTRKFPDGSPYLAHNYHLKLSSKEVPTQTEPHKSSPWKLVPKSKITQLQLIPGLKDYLLSV